MKLHPTAGHLLGCILGGMLFWGTPTPTRAAMNRTEVVVQSVLSGDSLLVRVEERIERVRLLGITCQDPTPRSAADRFRKDSNPKGDRARAFVQYRVKPGGTVWLELDRQPYDKSGNLLAYVYLADGTFLNEALLKAGLAWPRKHAPNDRYDRRFQKAYEKAAEK